MRIQKNYFLLFLLLTNVIVLKAQTIEKKVCPPSETEAYNAYKTKKVDGKHFGDAIDTHNAITYGKLLERIQKTQKIADVKVEGTVEAVCQARGCWMNLKGEAGAQPMMVKFKNYAFFMPKDIKGKKVVMMGEAFKETVSVDELRHYAEDDGKTPEEILKITKPEDKISFTARGVIVLD